MTSVLPELREVPSGLVLDGELVAWKGSEPYFPFVCRRVLNRDMSIPLTFVIFDVLRSKGVDLTKRPYRERRPKLERLSLNGPAWTTSETFDDGRALFEAVCRLGLEGVVAKSHTSLYRPNDRGWVKVKNPNYCVGTRSERRWRGRPTSNMLQRGHDRRYARREELSMETASEASTAMLEEILAAFNRHDVDGVMSYFDDDCVFETPSGPTPFGRRLVGLDEVRSGVAGRFAGIPNVHYGDDSHFVAGSRAVSEWTLRGTTTDGEELEFRGCDLWTLRNGKVVKKDSYWKAVE